MEEATVAQLTPDERDRARQRVGTATASIAILAAGAAGAVSVLAWHATEQGPAATGTSGSVSTGQVRGDDDLGQDDDSGQDDDEQAQQGGGGTWSGVSGGENPQPGGIQGAAPPAPGSGGGAVGSQGS
jgi:hypothetical protein